MLFPQPPESLSMWPPWSSTRRIVTFCALTMMLAPFRSRTSWTTAPFWVTTMSLDVVLAGVHPAGVPVVAGFGNWSPPVGGGGGGGVVVLLTVAVTVFDATT